VFVIIDLIFVELCELEFAGMRNPPRKTNRGTTSHETMLTAAKSVIADNASIRSTAKLHGVHYSTLRRYIKSVKAARDNNRPVPAPGYKSNRIVFSDDQEKAIATYLAMASDLYYGMSPIESRVLAYHCAVKFDVKHPEQWDQSQSVGDDWLSGLLSRNPQLSIRTPEATSLARATSFNRSTVAAFFDKLSTVMNRYSFQPSDIYNVDETGITTVQKPTKVISRKGMKQVGALTSGERGSLVTVELAVSASGNSVPPMFMFPRVRFHDHFIHDGPVGSIGVAHPSGWMTDSSFLTFIRHFIRHAKPSCERPVLLLLDNHSSHLSI